MNNEIGRKITSLTLLTILLASGITFAAPGAIPSAEASHNANLFVSAENSQFSNYFAGPQVVEIVINDPAISDTNEGKGEPDVTVNGKKVRMIQATDGNWYAYIADKTRAQAADETQANFGDGSTGDGLDFGKFCTAASATTVLGFSLTDTVGVVLAKNVTVTTGSDGTDALGACDGVTDTTDGRVNNVVRENKTINGASPQNGQIGFNQENLWPIIQLYDFSQGGNAIIKYNKGGGAQTTTLTFDTIPSNLISTSLDRATYPLSSEVHITMTDPQLNIDPTDEDVWTWDSLGSSNNVYYGLFTENGDADAVVATAQDLIGNLTAAFDFEKNGRVIINPAAQGGDAVAAFDDNTKQVLPLGYVPNGGTMSQQITFTESGASTGIFGNYDESDDANLDITATALRGKSATIRYNDVSSSIVVGFGYGTLTTGLLDGEWNSGEEIPVTLVDSDANKNSRADEDLDVFKPIIVLVPSLKIGTPFTLSTGDVAAYANGVQTARNGTDDRIRVINAHRNGFVTTPTVTVDTLSQIARLDSPATNGTIFFSNGTLGGHGNLVIDLNRDIAALQAVVKDPQGINALDRFRGLSLFNYDIRSLNENVTSTNKITGASIYLLINKAGAGTADTTITITGAGNSLNRLTAVSIGNVTSLSGLINLNSTTDAPGTTNDDSFYDAIYTTGTNGVVSTDDIGLLFRLNSTTGLTLGADTKPIVADFFSFGIIGDGLKTTERINNAIYRFQLEETGDNTSTFIGTAEFTMLNQINIFDSATYTGLKTIDDEVTFIVHEDLTDEDAPRINYADLGADGVGTTISTQEVAGTHSGVVSFDKETYKVADIVTITLEDLDLNVDSDLIDIYVTTASGTDPAADAVGVAGSGTYSNGDSIGRLLDVTFDDNRWIDGDQDGSDTGTAADCPTIDASATDAVDDGLADAGFTLVETGPATGVFTGSFDIPAVYCSPTAPTTSGVSVTGLDLEVNYVDFRDASGELIEVGDGAGVRANTGSISLDKTVYPVPFGKIGDFVSTGTVGKTPTQGTVTRSLFPIHATGIDAGETGTPNLDEAKETLGEGGLTIHVRVNDPDFDQSSGENKITQTSGFGPVKITVSRGADSVILAYAGRNTTHTGLIDAGTKSTVATTIRELGPITETGPSTGIFELDFAVLYTDGPSSAKCPTTGTFTSTNGVVTNTTESARFDAASADEYCILQGDILTVEYTDPTDASGKINTITDSATFDLRNGVLQSDKSVYIIGADSILTLIEPDLDLDSDSAETYDLDLIEWDSKAKKLTMGDLGGSAAKFDPEPSEFRETGDSTGIFQIVVEIPDALGGFKLDRGEEIELEYTDWGPAGANYVGDENEDIKLTIYTSNFGATVELDQKVYTWTDKVFITIVAPDHNFDSNLIDEIGESADDKIVVATRGNKLSNYKLVETGTDTGIFTGEVILTGFNHDADGKLTTGTVTTGFDTNPRTEPATNGGPTNGFLKTDDDDGLTVSFEFTEDETVVGSALIRWNIGEVQFLEASYPATGQGVVRIVDPDMNINPESVDTFDVDAWSDSDAGGIDLTVTETNEATGIFEGTVFFTVTSESSGNRLRVAEGDTVTTEYEDNTLPSPYTTADELEITATTFIGSIVPPLERAPASNPRIVDAFGNELDEVGVDQQVQITADLANGQDRDQSFAYLVQIQDEDGVTVSLSWITGSLAPGQSLNPAQSWTPTSPGTYNVQIFVWESVDNPDALSPPVSTTISVS